MRATDPRVITPDWVAPPRVRAAFTLRTGGVSAAPYDSLNLGARIGDAPEAVAENRRRVGETLQLPAEPVWLEQVHGVGVVEIGAAVGVRVVAAPGESGGAAALGGGAGAAALGGIGGTAALGGMGGAGLGAGVGVRDVPPTGDAAVAREAGQVCAIRVADCMPVLFAARDGSVVGAAHAGWRGLAGGVLEATVNRLGVPASQVIAWMGPAIGPQHFEVGEEVRAAFLASDSCVASAFTANARGRWQCDLYALARQRLEALGIGGIYGGGWCTFADAEQFFSYRRDGQTGRMAALIWIEPERR